MRSPIKAALLSALVFPGLGQIYLKRYAPGVVFIVLTIAAMVFLVWRSVMMATRVLDAIGQGSATFDFQRGLAAPQGDDSTLSIATSFLLLCCWVLSVVHAYMAGKAAQRQGNQET
jgi:hypothetical protein